MKKTTTIMLLIAVILTSVSCKKESTKIENDFILNSRLDQELFDNAVTMSSAQIEDHARRKFEVLTRIKNANPGITVQQIYPNIDFVRPQQRPLTDCVAEFNSQRTNCNIIYIGTSTLSTGIGFLVGVLNPFAGVAVGATLLAAQTASYKVCVSTAFIVRDNCLRDQK